MPKTNQKSKARASSLERGVNLRLTPLEADMLSLVAGNGWGDGDFREYLSDRVQSSACIRAMNKLSEAIRKQAVV